MIGGMKMFVCLDCGNIFAEPKHYVDKHGFDIPPFEERDGCPYCGGAYAEAHQCDCCGKWIDDDYIKIKTGERFCCNCFTGMELGEEN